MVFLVSHGSNRLCFAYDIVFTLTFALSIFPLCYERKDISDFVLYFFSLQKYKNINFWWHFLLHCVVI